MVQGWINSFWGGRYVKFYKDIREFNPLSPSNSGSSIQSCFKKHKAIKKKPFESLIHEVEHPHWCSLQLEVWLIKPQFFTRDWLACCGTCGRSHMHQFWMGQVPITFLFSMISYSMYQRSSVFSRPLHQVCSCRFDSIKDFIFVLVYILFFGLVQFHALLSPKMVFTLGP